MAFEEVYVDPSLASNTGSGTSGAPYGDLEWAISLKTTAGNGYRFNVKAGTPEALTANLTPAYTPTEAAPFIIQGYKTTAGDGDFQAYLADQDRSLDNNGIAEINLTNFRIGDGATSFIHLRHLEIHNSTSVDAVDFDNDCSMVECDMHSISGNNYIHTDNYALICGNYFHDIVNSPTTGNHNIWAFNYFENGTTNKFTDAFAAGGSCNVIGNIFDLDSTSDAIALTSLITNTNIMNNTLYTSGTGDGISFDATGYVAYITGNYIEGFDEGIGGSIASANLGFHFVYNNRFYDCTTNINSNLTSSPTPEMYGDNVGLTATGLSKSGTKNVQNRLTYFAPVDTDSDMFGSGYAGYNTPGAAQLVSGGIAPTGVFNAAKGRVAELAKRVIDNDPANSELVLVLATGAATDATIQDYDTLAALLGDAGITEANFTNYARKYVTSGITQTPDDTNDRLDVDVPDQTWTSAGGAANNTLTRLFLCYGPDSTSRSDATTIPLCYYDVSHTTDGTDLVISFNAQGAYSAS